MTIEDVRKLFPYLETGRIYFNHASVSPFSKRVTNSIEDYIRMRSITDIDNISVFMSAIENAKKNIASMINTKPDRIAFVDNTSNGLNVIAQGIEWKKGDRIILNDIEFPSNIYPFMNLRQYGVEIDLLHAKNGVISAEDIINAVKPTTKLISISSVQFLSGYRVDIDKLGEYCKKKNILLSVDAIQEIGALKVDVKKSRIHFLACGTQKWMMGLMGLAFIYISDELQEKIKPKYVGWNSVENPWELLNYDFVLKKSADAFQNGSVSLIGVTGLNAAISLFKDFGLDEVEKRVLDNSEYLIKSFEELGLNPLLKGLERKYLSGIVSFTSSNVKQIFEELKKENISVTMREGFIRFSPHFYNTLDELSKAVDIVNSTLK